MLARVTDSTGAGADVGSSMGRKRDIGGIGCGIDSFDEASAFNADTAL